MGWPVDPRPQCISARGVVACSDRELQTPGGWWGSIPAPPRTGCVPLGSPYDLSEPQRSHVWSGAATACPAELLRGSNALMCVGLLGQRLASRKCGASCGNIGRHCHHYCHCPQGFGLNVTYCEGHPHRDRRADDL